MTVIKLIKKKNSLKTHRQSHIFKSDRMQIQHNTHILGVSKLTEKNFVQHEKLAKIILVYHTRVATVMSLLIYMRILYSINSHNNLLQPKVTSSDVLFGCLEKVEKAYLAVFCLQLITLFYHATALHSSVIFAFFQSNLSSQLVKLIFSQFT